MLVGWLLVGGVVWLFRCLLCGFHILGKYSRSEVRVDRSVLQARVHAVMAIYANDCKGSMGINYCTGMQW